MDDELKADRGRALPTTKPTSTATKGEGETGAWPADDVRGREVDRILLGIVPVRLRAPGGVPGARAQGEFQAIGTDAPVHRDRLRVDLGDDRSLPSVILLITIPFIFISSSPMWWPLTWRRSRSRSGWAFPLEKANRPSGPYMALFVGLIVLYLVFMIPFCFLGVVAQFFTALLGLGAMTMTYLAHRQARKEAAVGGTPVSS